MNGGQIGGWVGGIAGCLIGIAGGIVGTWFSIRNTKGPRERAFMIRLAVVWWVAALIFLGLMFALPNPYQWFLWIPYAILLPLGITYGNRKQRSIRQQESQQQADGTQ